MELGESRDLHITHVVTMIAQSENGAWKFYLFDPTVDGTFVDENGKFMDIASVIERFDRSSRTMAVDFFDADECVVRDRITHKSDGIVVEKEAKYCISEWMFVPYERAAREKQLFYYEERMNSYQIDPLASMHLDMLLSHVHSIGEAIDPRARDAFIVLLKQYGTRYQ